MSKEIARLPLALSEKEEPAPLPLGQELDEAEPYVEPFKRKRREPVPRLTCISTVSLQGCPGRKPEAITPRSSLVCGSGQPFIRFLEIGEEVQKLVPEGCWLIKHTLVVVENIGQTGLRLDHLYMIPAGQYQHFFPISLSASEIKSIGGVGKIKLAVFP